MHTDIRGQKQLQETRRAPACGQHASGLKIAIWLSETNFTVDCKNPMPFNIHVFYINAVL